MVTLRSSVVAALLSALVLGCAAAGLPQDGVVRRVIDGDTIELRDGRLVRYIGVDAPEVRRRAGEEWVEDPEPFGFEAKDANRRWVEGRSVRLEYDVQTHDRYGRLLAYVFVDGRMVNAALLEEGYAQLLTIPPNVKYAEPFRRFVQEARAAHRGLWGALE
ncbi:MAG: thermonuclease family protein [Candidatus Omnitrophica bacterium]|nr:thermonuclease family protein [Candidatus Omnitrophota bacterium]